MYTFQEIAPSMEEERIEVLKNYEILDTPSDGSLDRLTKLAAQLLKMPIAIVSFVDKDRIWFKSHYGLKIKEVDRHPGLCASAIESGEFYMVEDALTDKRTSNNPLVTGDFGLRFYAGMPLRTKEGFNLGTFSVIDLRPRKLTQEEKEILMSLAELVMYQLELLQEAKIAVRNQNHILNTAVHDLKNPLSIMPLLAEMIIQNKDNPQAIDDISNQIKEAGKRMASTIEDLLETAREEKGSVHLRLRKFKLSKLVENVVVANEMLAKKKEQLLFFKTTRGACNVYGDEKKLTEVIDNLINNAIKYSPPKKEIQVNVRTRDGKAIVEVRDNGPGLSKDDLKNLFRRFTSLSALPTGGENSTGLGLFIAKNLVDAHNGTIFATSDGEGKGASFVVELPLSKG